MPTDLRALAEALEASARAAKARGELESAFEFLEAASVLRRHEDAAPLTGPNQRGNNQGMVTAERVRVSKGRKQRDALVVAANTHNYTLRSLAEKLKDEGFEVTHALLSQARTGKRSLSEALAKRVEVLTGFKASRANWPGIRKE